MAGEPYLALVPLSMAAASDNDIKPLNEGDRDVMEALRDVLIKHNATERFGITLLHQHFEIGEDEILLETNDSANRSLTIRPHKGSSEGTLETAWKFNKEQSGPVGFLRCRGEWYWDHSTNPPTYRYQHWSE